MAEGQSYTKSRVLSDLFGVGIDKQYQTVSAKVKIPAAAVGALSVKRHDLFGQPVKLVTGVWTFVLAGDEANTEGLLYQGDSFVELSAGDSTPTPCTILLRGPGIVKSGGWPANDIEGAALTPADIITVVEVLNPPLISVDESGAVSQEATL